MCAARRPYRLFGLLFLNVFAFSRSAVGTCHRINYAHNIHSIAWCCKATISTGAGKLILRKNKFALISGETFEGQKNPKNVRSLKLLFFRIRNRFFIHGKTFEIFYDIDQTSESIIITSPPLKYFLPIGEHERAKFPNQTRRGLYVPTAYKLRIKN